MVCVLIISFSIDTTKVFSTINITAWCQAHTFLSISEMAFLWMLLVALHFWSLRTEINWEDTQLFSRITFDAAESTLTNAFLHLTWVLSKAIALTLPSPVHSFPSPCLVFLYRGPSWKRHVSMFVNLLPFVFLMSDPGVLFQGGLVWLSPW